MKTVVGYSNLSRHEDRNQLNRQYSTLHSNDNLKQSIYIFDKKSRNQYGFCTFSAWKSKNIPIVANVG